MAGAKNQQAKPYGPGQTFGRPAHYSTPEELQVALEDYFTYSINNRKPFTVTGLALHLGFCSRATLDDYEKRSEDFSYVIKRARAFVENGYETRLLDTEGNNVTGAIFALKNMGWRDRSEVESHMTGNTITTPEQFDQLLKAAREGSASNKGE